MWIPAALLATKSKKEVEIDCEGPHKPEKIQKRTKESGNAAGSMLSLMRGNI